MMHWHCIKLHYQDVDKRFLIGRQQRINIGVRANFFLGGLSHHCPKKLTAGEKNCYANLQNYFAQLTQPSNY